MEKVIFDIIKAFAWAITASLSMSLALGILLKVYDMMTPINEWEEIRKGNIACAIIMASVVLAFGFVVGMAISAPDVPPAAIHVIATPGATISSAPSGVTFTATPAAPVPAIEDTTVPATP